MKKHLVLLSALLLQAVAVSMFAQVKPVAGDTISGRICDNNRPLKSVRVLETDSSDKIVAECLTDSTGFFSFKLINPTNSLHFLYEEGRGYSLINKPIDKRYYDIDIKKEDVQLLDVSYNVK